MATTVSNQLATDDKSGKVVPFSQAIQSKGYQALINSTLKDPKRVNRFVTAVVSAVSANPQLQKCEARTSMRSFLTALIGMHRPRTTTHTKLNSKL